MNILGVLKIIIKIISKTLSTESQGKKKKHILKLYQRPFPSPHLRRELFIPFPQSLVQRIKFLSSDTKFGHIQ